MISRSNMRRQLRASGGIMNARQGYGVGSWVKERIRKIIPNELADVAVKAAPFVAPFFPGAAAAMRGIGRFDQRGSIGDAVRQAGATYAFGKAAGKLGGAEGSELLNPGRQTYTKAGFDAGPIGKMFAGDPSNTKIATDAAKGTQVGVKSVSEATKFMKNIPIIRDLPPLVQQQLLIGGVTSAGTYVYEKFLKEEPPKDEGETMEEYMARRKENVGSKMRNYFDSYFTFDKNYSSMTNEQKDAEVARYNVNQGGLMRQNYQTGGISMTNTAAQNKSINDARRTQNQSMLEAARARLPGGINFQSKLLQQNNFGGPPSGNTPVTQTQKPYSGETPAPVEPTLSQDYVNQLNSLRTQQTSAGMSGDDLIPNNYQVGESMAPLGVLSGQRGSGIKQQMDFLNQGIGQGLTYNQTMDNYMDQQVAREEADMLKYSTFADGRTIDPMQGKSSYNDLLDVFKYDYPNVTLTGNESLAELDQMLLNMRDNKANGGLMRTGYANGSEEFQSYLKGRQKFEKEMSLEELYKDFLRMKKDQRIAEEKTMAADGGLMRLNYMIGGEAKQMEAGAPPIMYSGNMDPNAPNQQAGLPSVPGPMQMAEDGPEFDMRENGGFQPLGRQEGKDDVPAMLAKNEFVMTADAVRAAGGGSIQKGAQKMYDTMKKLESRVS